MSALDTWFKALENTSLPTEIREGAVLFPWIECVHVLALAIVVGFIAIVDLRLLGFASKDRSVKQISSTALPITWTAFGLAAITGGLLFSSNAVTYAHNRFFQFKMLLLLLAGANMLLFHMSSWRQVAQWNTAATTSRGANVAGAVSLTLWIAIIACGRWIGFTL
jgi:hypothetical protein